MILNHTQQTVSPTFQVSHPIVVGLKPLKTKQLLIGHDDCDKSNLHVGCQRKFKENPILFRRLSDLLS